jgi:ankyrin repeat protein
VKQLDNIQMWNDARVVDEGTGETPLLAACAAGSFEICEALINAGADVRAADKDGNTPLLAACGEGSFGLSGNSDVVRLLMKAGADVATDKHKRTEDYYHNNYLHELISCLHLAIKKGSKVVVKMLLAACAAAKDAKEKTCLHLAASKGAVTW